MIDLYNELKKKNGRTCYTLSQNKPALMHVDDWNVTITYPTGRVLELPRSMVSEAIHRLQAKGMLTVQEIHYELTNQRGPQTDRLMAVLREIPGVTFTAAPRALYWKK